MNSLRARLLTIFLASTIIPLGLTVWLAAGLLDRSLNLTSTQEIESLSHTLEVTGRALYQSARQDLKKEVAAGLKPQTFAAQSADLPAAWQEFLDSDESDRFVLGGDRGERIEYLKRAGSQLLVYSHHLNGIGLKEIEKQRHASTAAVERAQSRDLKRGFLYTFLLLAAAVWVASLAALVFTTYRLSVPIQKLTSALRSVAEGDLSVRLNPAGGKDEVSEAMRAFNQTATELAQSRDRLVYLTQIASWQVIARKMAHEVKNSLTPIRLTMEELLARRRDTGDKFLEQASQIVVDEVATLERRIRAFSRFAAEPPVAMKPLDLDSLLEERIQLLKSAHPEVSYEAEAAHGELAYADEDLVKGVLTNLLSNAAEAAGIGGRVRSRVTARDGRVAIEVHDSGPGLTEEARRSLFKPAISFKKNGMGLGLSIARKSAMLCGGDIELLENGELGGAAFRVLLPQFQNGGPGGNQANQHRR